VVTGRAKVECSTTSERIDGQEEVEVAWWFINFLEQAANLSL